MKLYRVHRGGQPAPGDAGGAAHVGDFATKAEALAAGAMYEGAWLEPIDFNGDLAEPVYTNAGAIVAIPAREGAT